MDLVALYAAAVAASLAALLDVRYRRIPNWLTGTVFAAGIALHGFRDGPNGVLFALAGGVLGLAILLPFYAGRVIGAGDVKLLAALGAMLGAASLVSVAVYGALVGGVISAAMLARAGRLFQVLNEILVQHRPPTRGGATAPYGVAIASGTFLSLLLPRIVG